MVDPSGLSGWFAGPKAENGDAFVQTIRRIAEDYYAWRRNYFPEDGVVLGAHDRRQNEPFEEAFEDRLLELLARLKSDYPFQSPRYAAHMLAEQTLPSIAGYFAALLYNPNNVTSEAAPVTVRLELEASRMIAEMLGYGTDSWSHLTSGGTVANIEALWVARTVQYLGLVVRDMRQELGLDSLAVDHTDSLLGLSPIQKLKSFEGVFADAATKFGASPATTRKVVEAYLSSKFCVPERGLASALKELDSEPVVLLPETHHYCFEKAMDALGMGRRSLVRVRVDHEFRMDLEDLQRTLETVTAEGRHVLAVVAVVGSTEEGAVDPVHKIADLRSQREAAGESSFWLHADGAYGGYLRTMTRPERIGLGAPTTRSKISGREIDVLLKLPVGGTCDALDKLGACDSITVDPHKLGYIPYPAGAVCFKSNLVKPILRQDAPYLEEGSGDVAQEQASDAIGVYVLEGSKPGAAAAAVWLSHSLIPLDSSGHGLLIQQTVRNACELSALLEEYPNVVPDSKLKAVPLCAPGSNIVCYAFRPAVGPVRLAALNRLNRAIYDQFSIHPLSSKRVYDQRFFVSRTTLSPAQYSESAVSRFLDLLGVSLQEYRDGEVFLLRSVLMNPWYEACKARGRYFVSELVEELYRAAEACWKNREPLP